MRKLYILSKPSSSFYHPLCSIISINVISITWGNWWCNLFLNNCSPIALHNSTYTYIITLHLHSHYICMLLVRAYTTYIVMQSETSLSYLWTNQWPFSLFFNCASLFLAVVCKTFKENRLWQIIRKKKFFLFSLEMKCNVGVLVSRRMYVYARYYNDRHYYTLICNLLNFHIKLLIPSEGKIILWTVTKKWSKQIKKI